MVRGRKTLTPAEQIEALRQRRVELAKRRDEASRRRDEAERALRELPGARQEAMRAPERGADAEVPSGAELQATVAEAKERIEAIKAEEGATTAAEHVVVDSTLGFVEEPDLQALKEAGAALERAVESVRAAEIKVRAAMTERSIVRLAYIRRGEDPPPELLPADFASLALELEEARRIITRHERAIRGSSQLYADTAA
jgi:hypothetical protein